MNLALALAGLAVCVSAVAGDVPLPSPDPLGYPLPPIWLQMVSYLTLTLHFLAMNLTIGSLAIYLWLRATGKRQNERLAQYLGSILPLGTSYLITFGVPPLLFVQVLYGQMFYSSSILIGFHWILVIPLVIFFYGVFYWQKLAKDPGRPGLVAFSFLAAVAMLGVGFFYVNNITLSFSPERWIDMYRNSPGGHNLNLEEPTLFARWLLILVPGLTVSGVAILFRGVMMLKWGCVEEGRHNQRLAMRVAIWGMVLEAAAGAWTLAMLPHEVRAYVTSGGWPTLLLGLGILLAAGGIWLIVLGSNRSSLAFPTLAALALFLALMPLVALRDLVRLEYLRPHFALVDIPVNLQWGMASLFGGFLLMGLGFLAVLHVLVVPKLVAARRAELDRPS